MRNIHVSLLLISLSFAQICTNAQPPRAPSQPVTETYFGKQVTDPYRNLENLKDSTVLQWLKAQSDYTQAVLKSLPGRQQLLDMMRDLDKRVSARITNLVITNNDVYFYVKTIPGEETGKLYMRKGFAGKETLLFDPNEYGKETMKKYTITNCRPSDDGSVATINIAPNGSEVGEILIMDVVKRTLYAEKINETLGGITWLPGNRSFLVNRRGPSAGVHDVNRQVNAKVYLHTLGTDPSGDKEFFSAMKYPDLQLKPQDKPHPMYDKNSNYVFVYLVSSADRRMKVLYAPASELNNASVNWKILFRPEDGVNDFSITDQDIYIYTALNAPNYKILKTSLAHPDVEHAETVVAENPGEVIESFRLTSTGLYYTTIKNGVEAFLYYLPKGNKTAHKLRLPISAGAISINAKEEKGWIVGRGGYKYPEIWLTVSGWTNSTKRYRYLPDKDQFKPEMLATPEEFPELADLIVEELTVPSHDGIEIPLTLIHKKDLKMDGNNRVALIGYGAYGISSSPSFSPLMLSATTKGVILAFAHVRGGGELGEQWHKAGQKTTKPNTWKDVISCAEYLVRKKFTSPSKLVLNGGSAGGIMVGRAMTERPDLFAAVIPEVGVMNPLRFEATPNGRGNIPEFGTIKDSIECMALFEMDSYHHLEKGKKYPATLVTAGMNDPRVIVWQPAKFAALLQEMNGSDKPILLRVDYSSGHGFGDVKSVLFERIADLFSFAYWQTDHPDFQLKDKKAF